VVDEAVDHRGGDDVVAEDLAPAAERLVGGDDHRGAFVAAGDEREHQVRGLRIERDVADFVADDYRDPGQRGELVFEASVAFGVGEPGDPLRGGREAHAMAGQAGADRERNGEVGLAGPRRAQRDDRVFGVQEVELGEVLDHRLLHAALEAEVELLERLASREACLRDAGLAAVRVARGDLGGQQHRREALIGPLLGAGALGQPGQRPRGRGRLERAEQVREFAGVAHDTASRS
jgi:hypothetical protein